MNKNAILVLGVSLLGATTVLAADDYKVDVSKLPPVSSQKNVTFATDVKPLIEKSCLKCHSGERPKGRLKLDTLENALKGGASGKAIIAGKSAESPIIGYTSDLVVDMEMPPVDQRKDFPALTKEQVGLLRAWIDQGAK
jgi:hypothetical protein